MNQLFLLKILISISLFALLVHSARSENYNTITNTEITQGVEEEYIINASSPLVLTEFPAEEVIGDSAYSKPTIASYALEITLCVFFLFIVGVLFCYPLWKPKH
jgi:hypothetical protein